MMKFTRRVVVSDITRRYRRIFVFISITTYKGTISTQCLRQGLELHHPKSSSLCIDLQLIQYQQATSVTENSCRQLQATKPTIHDPT